MTEEWVPSEEDKALIGDLYVRKDFRTVERENLLIDAALGPVMDHPAVARIEAQLLMVRHDPARPVPRADCLRVFERNFMRIDLKDAEFCARCLAAVER